MVSSCRNCLYSTLMSSISASFCLFFPKGDFQSKERSASSELKSLFCLSVSVFARRPVCLSEHILGEMSERYWQRWAGNQLASAHIVQPAHILLIQFWEIARPQKKLSLFCHSVSQVTFTANNLTAGEKRADNRKSFFPTKDWSAVGGFQTFIYNTMMPPRHCNDGRRCRAGKNTFRETY